MALPFLLLYAENNSFQKEASLFQIICLIVFKITVVDIDSFQGCA